MCLAVHKNLNNSAVYDVINEMVCVVCWSLLVVLWSLFPRSGASTGGRGSGEVGGGPRASQTTPTGCCCSTAATTWSTAGS